MEYLVGKRYFSLVYKSGRSSKFSVLSDPQSPGYNPIPHVSKWLPVLPSSHPLSNRRMEEGTQKGAPACFKRLDGGGHMLHSAQLSLAIW